MNLCHLTTSFTAAGVAARMRKSPIPKAMGLQTQTLQAAAELGPGKLDN